MKIVGLTGSIAMGKSTAAAMLRRLGVPVHDADATVHRLMGPGGAALPAIAEAFPGAVVGGRVDRTVLGAQVFGDAAALARLEAILHPLVHGETHTWLRRQALAGRPLVVLDIPLLFEAGRDRVCDAVLVVSAPARVQRQRMLARPGMTEDRLDAVLSRQLGDGEKRRRADFVIPTGLGKGVTFRAIQRILEALEEWPARHWPPPRP
ncbi:MAG: dephospho-CoA kinase [Rhodospirillaceae bacterium]|nr:dephospho-CoA kinase [Rhodospirillaceae bacterium]